MSTHTKLETFWILLALNVLMLMINIDYTAVNLALVTIAKDVNVDLNTVQWVLSGYVLAWSALVIPCGKMADIFGKRRMLLYGVWVFVIASFLIGIAENIYLIIAGRFLQGIGGALFVPPIYTLIFASVPKENHGMAIGTLGITAGVGLAAGPSFGGLILHHFGWQWIFFVNIPIGFCVLAIALLTIKKEPQRTSDEKIDHQSALFLAASLVLLMFGFNQMEEWSLSSPMLWGVFAASIFLMVSFIFRQRKAEVKMIPLSFFKNKSYLGCVMGIFCFEFIMSAYIVLMALYLQNVHDFDAQKAGYIFLAMTLCFAIFSPIGGKLADKFDGRIPIMGGMLVTAIGAGMAMFFTPDEGIGFIVVSLFFSGLGLGMSIAPVNAIMMQSVEEEHVSTASGIFAMVCLLGATIGIIFSTSLLTYLARNDVVARIVDSGIQMTEKQFTTLYEVISTARYSPETFLGFSAEMVEQIIPMIDQSFTDAMSVIFLCCVILALFEVVTSYILIKPNTISRK